MHVPLHDQLGYFAKKKWKPINNITTYNHFEFNSDPSDKGKVTCHHIFDGPKTKIDITSDIDSPNDFPPSLVPEGLSWKVKNTFSKISALSALKIIEICCAPTPVLNPIPQQTVKKKFQHQNKTKKRKKEQSAETLTNKLASSKRPSRRKRQFSFKSLVACKFFLNIFNFNFTIS